MTSVADQARPESTQPAIFSAADQQETLDLVRKLTLVNSVSDHRASTRHRHEGPELLAFLRLAICEIRMALDGASIDDILKEREA